MEKNMKKNIDSYIYICNWISLLYTRNWHNIVNQLQFNKNKFSKRDWFKDFPGGPVAKTRCSQCKGPWSGNYILHATTKAWHTQISKLIKINLKITIRVFSKKKKKKDIGSNLTSATYFVTSWKWLNLSDSVFSFVIWRCRPFQLWLIHQAALGNEEFSIGDFSSKLNLILKTTVSAYSTLGRNLSKPCYIFSCFL